ncbi:hypothetical protein A0H81_10898 [Grifola frondosa]|uniref:Uncharacterized protein n=1 Tax=Grifola frondosa TaxID=5627 RepID=A0A1C7LWQ6_GRIFR|nr:hypothetical protein A0H81_10898 [Grifola frondosa]
MYWAPVSGSDAWNTSLVLLSAFPTPAPPGESLSLIESILGLALSPSFTAHVPIPIYFRPCGAVAPRLTFAGVSITNALCTLYPTICEVHKVNIHKVNRHTAVRGQFTTLSGLEARGDHASLGLPLDLQHSVPQSPRSRHRLRNAR